jgi:hypothetical protein
MPHSLAQIILWLFVINLGIAFGAGLYEARITVPQWLSFTPGAGYRWNSAAAAEANVGLRFWVYVSTIPLTLLTLASLALAWMAPSPLREWWLFASLSAVAERALTFGYFIPTMVRLMRGDIQPPSAAVAKAVRWVRMGLVRQAATFLAWLAALEAFALSHQTMS